jgi:hypothetical protein
VAVAVVPLGQFEMHCVWLLESTEKPDGQAL